ncbi:MAG: hypothetical protein ACO1N9_10945 [Flavobacterium sp.]
MKILVNIVLFMFLSFLAAPTVVSLIDNDDADISMVYSLTEEELQKEIKEVKAHASYEYQPVFFETAKQSSEIKSENLQRHDSAFEEIFSPPPETV